MRKHSRITVTLIALVVALAPGTCVCADSMIFDEAVKAVTDTPADCHFKAPAPEVDSGEPCTGCGDGALASVSKIDSDTFDLVPFGSDFSSTGPFADVRFATPVVHRRHFRRSTPVSLSVVLLN